MKTPTRPSWISSSHPLLPRSLPHRFRIHALEFCVYRTKFTGTPTELSWPGVSGLPDYDKVTVKGSSQRIQGSIDPSWFGTGWTLKRCAGIFKIQ